MKKVKIAFTVPGILFGILGLTETLSYNISLPIMFACMGPVFLCSGIEKLRAEKKVDTAADFIFAAVFLILAAAGILQVVQ